jgi:hypothetical protein
VRLIDRKDLRAPARVIDIELAQTRPDDQAAISVEHYHSVWCLSRFDGIPREISCWDVTGDRSLSTGELRGRLGAAKPACGQPDPGRAAGTPGPDSPGLTVVICTRDRPAGLRATLASLQRQTDQDFGILIVDNGSAPAGPGGLPDLPRVTYLVEPRQGLARARNRALRAVDTALVAWIDDDETADPDWVRRLRQGFAHESAPAAVCGVMLPAELQSEAQVRFEQYGGFNKGRGLTPEVLRMGTSSVVSPLYPLPAFGPGGNMAFRTEYLHAIGRFDPCLGAGTRTHGGEETRVLSLLLSSGQAVLHWPAAITWHTHRREMPALRQQFYGYSAGLSAFYASMVRSRPAAALDVLRLAPHALKDLRGGRGSLRSGQLPGDFPACLLRAARRGLLEGGFMYAYEAIRERCGAARP